jgi:hypothetical protein
MDASNGVGECLSRETSPLGRESYDGFPSMMLKQAGTVA